MHTTPRSSSSVTMTTVALHELLMCLQIHETNKDTNPPSNICMPSNHGEMAASDVQESGRTFIDQYYRFLADSNCRDLRMLYREISMMVFEGMQFEGVNAIIAKLKRLQADRVMVDIKSCWSMRLGENAFLTQITGQVANASEEYPSIYDQAVIVVRESNGSYFVLYDVFRVVDRVL